MYLARSLLMYRQVLNSLSLVTLRPSLNFTGAGVVCTDDPVNDCTTITIGDTAGETPYTDTAPLLHATTVQAAIDSAKRSLPIQLRAVTPAAANSNPYVQQSLPVITLPDNCKILSGNGGNTVSLVVPSANYGAGWARAGTGTLGPLSGNVSVGAGQYAATASGDLVFNATDAWTSVDIGYLPNRYDVVSGTYVCTPGTGVVAGLPTGIIFILEAEILVGGSLGGKIVFFPNSTAPSAGQCRLNLAKTGVFFAIADAATSVRLKLGVIPAVNY